MRFHPSLVKSVKELSYLSVITELHFLASPHMGDTAAEDNADVVTTNIPDSNEQTSEVFKFKKRVQFLPDNDLVRVREIPPRSNRSSLEESDESDSDASSSSDSASSTETEESSDSDSESTPSSKHGLNNMTVTKRPSTLAQNNTLGLRPQPGSLTPATTPKVTRPPATISNSKTTPLSKTRVSLKLDVNNRLDVTSRPMKREDSGDLPARDLKTVSKSRATLKSREINVSSLPQHKNSKLFPSFNPQSVSTKVLPKKGVAGAPQNKQTPSKRNTEVIVNTSSNTAPSALLADVDVIKPSVQTVTIGQLYTMDGFIFPSDQVSDPRLPIISTSKMTNMVSRVNSISDRRSGLELPPTPQKLTENGVTISSIKMSRNENLPAKGGKRYFAWQMANGSARDTLQTTPNIAQLWDDAPMTSSVGSLWDSVSDSK